MGVATTTMCANQTHSAAMSPVASRQFSTGPLGHVRQGSVVFGSVRAFVLAAIINGCVPDPEERRLGRPYVDRHLSRPYVDRVMTRPTSE